MKTYFRKRELLSMEVGQSMIVAIPDNQVCSVISRYGEDRKFSTNRVILIEKKSMRVDEAVIVTRTA